MQPLVERHSALRTLFGERDGVPYQQDGGSGSDPPPFKIEDYWQEVDEWSLGGS